MPEYGGRGLDMLRTRHQRAALSTARSLCGSESDGLRGLLRSEQRGELIVGLDSQTHPGYGYLRLYIS